MTDERATDNAIRGDRATLPATGFSTTEWADRMVKCSNVTGDLRRFHSIKSIAAMGGFVIPLMAYYPSDVTFRLARSCNRAHNFYANSNRGVFLSAAKRTVEDG